MPPRAAPPGLSDTAVLSVPDADRLLRDHARRLGAETVALDDAAGRTLRADVHADRDLPPFDRVTMDGIAVSSRTAARRFVVASAQHAGEPRHTLAGPESCVEVTTGAVLPLGADAVVPVERLGIVAGTATLLDGVGVEAGQFVHRRGSDRAAGATVLRAGTRLGPAHVAALASVGAARVVVGARPRVTVVTTGDELVAVDAPVLPHQVRQSNGHAALAALALHGFPGAALGHAPDDAALLERVLGEALAASDVLVVTGGVSAGRLDLVPDVLARLDVACVFHHIAQRPGKPLWFGVVPDGPAVFGLPGNPVSALTCLVRYVVPFLAACEGADRTPPQTVRFDTLPARPPGLTAFLPVRVEGHAAAAVPTGGSGDLVSLLPTAGFAEVGPDAAAPAVVPFHPWSPR